MLKWGDVWAWNHTYTCTQQVAVHTRKFSSKQTCTGHRSVFLSRSHASTRFYSIVLNCLDVVRNRLKPELELVSSKPAALGVTVLTISTLGRISRLEGL